jgi:hypothetical protein
MRAGFAPLIVLRSWLRTSLASSTDFAEYGRPSPVRLFSGLFEEQLFLRVAGNGRGGVEVTGEAWDMSPGNRLRFGLSLDQTYLEEPIRQLEATVAQMALRSKPAG